MLASKLFTTPIRRPRLKFIIYQVPYFRCLASALRYAVRFSAISSKLSTSTLDYFLTILEPLPWLLPRTSTRSEVIIKLLLWQSTLFYTDYMSDPTQLKVNYHIFHPRTTALLKNSGFRCPWLPLNMEILLKQFWCNLSRHFRWRR